MKCLDFLNDIDPPDWGCTESMQSSHFLIKRNLDIGMVKYLSSGEGEHRNSYYSILDF
uniref:Uncharacterized protein n=1 Tax=Nelumbo nucifera TaxID=4432 RepID=A0A822YD70_NELNU|nr:TPA_asm: hypothetical protein HUJ06_009371 [Nelumbo nucifera]